MRIEAASRKNSPMSHKTYNAKALETIGDRTPGRPGDHGKSLVLLVHSHDDTREMLRRWLEAEGCRVMEAVNGHQAIELTRSECPDLILMSLRMPARDGIETTRRIREHIGACDVPIVAMSTYPTQEERASARDAGYSSFISQPIDFSHLGNILTSLLPESHSLLLQQMVGA